MKTKLATLTALAFVATASAFYNPEVGRWLNRDPIGEKGGQNLLAFAGNNAIDNYDPLGQAVGVRHNNGVRPGLCGDVSWDIYYWLDPAPATAGWIIQTLTLSWDVKDCSGRPLRFRNRPNPGSVTYWEAWQVLAGLQEPLNNPDQFSNSSKETNLGADCTMGTLKWDGVVGFHPSYQLPSTFRPRNPETGAGDLPSTTQNPNLPGAESSFVHQLHVSWNCCPPGGAVRRSTRIDGIAPWAE